MTGWAWFAIYYVAAAVGFGVHHVMWVRDQTAKGLPVASPVGQFVFTVLCAPLALAIVLALGWSIVLAGLGLFARL